MAEMTRINTRITEDLNNWLNERSEKTGVPKSTQVMLALEFYRQQQVQLATMSDMVKLGERLEKLEDLETTLKERL